MLSNFYIVKLLFSHNNVINLVMHQLIPIGLCGEKIEIMRFEQGKLCVKNDEICAKLCVKRN